MALTPQQLTTLKAAILAETDPTFAQYRTDGNNGAMMVWLNEVASPTFFVYKSALTESDVFADNFDWVEVDNLTAGKARIWDWMFRNGAVNPASPQIRAGIAECWKGTAAKLAVRAQVFAKFQRAATRAEKVLATGAGTTIDQDGNGPATASFSGSLTLDDVRATMAS